MFVCSSQSIENVYALFLLTGGFRSDISSKLYGTLDLGGGSIQITLNPVDPVCALIVSITKFLIVIGHPRTYFLHNWHMLMWVSNYNIL